MQLGETIATYDVALALRGENGKFDVTSPTGELYQVICSPDHSITNLQCSGNGANHQPFLIRKVAQPVSSVPQKVGANGSETTHTRVPTAPFLITVDENDSSSEATAAPANASPLPAPVAEELADLDLLYLEVEPKSLQPSAWVCLRVESQQRRGTMITNACTTFNELDAEIRRLHAQLDDIRYRARKKFYQAHAVAAGA